VSQKESGAVVRAVPSVTVNVVLAGRRARNDGRGQVGFEWGLDRMSPDSAWAVGEDRMTGGDSRSRLVVAIQVGRADRGVEEGR
jgi:hypothetical protein